jgi:hypothetical protein
MRVKIVLIDTPLYYAPVKKVVEHFTHNLKDWGSNPPPPLAPGELK